MFPEIMFDWPQLFSWTFKTTFDTKLQNFQYRFLHHTIYTNSKLFKIKIILSSICNFCVQHEKTIELLFWDSSITRNFFDLNNWINTSMNLKLKLIFSDICFGLPSSTLITNLVLICLENVTYTDVKYRTKKQVSLSFKIILQEPKK